MRETDLIERLVERFIVELDKRNACLELAGVSQYLTMGELAGLVGCKANQRARMVKWLEAHHWRFVMDSRGLPKVARAYHDRKMGISEGNTSPRYADGPNRQAFAVRA
ncbi:DUF4224 domain-containing protein [Ralstonia sp. UBA689]|uniref:DUF4224 domain-containing protein n=1 Tax=Ralstonia sp. UBA689 TaxID=1947373 RepID=UPI0025FC06AE|nr:DUF4224 domain-containing protein [Ralstonia sp. UBA689]